MTTRSSTSTIAPSTVESTPTTPPSPLTPQIRNQQPNATASRSSTGSQDDEDADDEGDENDDDDFVDIIGSLLPPGDEDDDDDCDFDADEPFIGGLSEATSAGGLLQQQPSLRITTQLMQRVEVVYVLGLFLVGKYRKKVQRKLAELRLIPGMSDVFDDFKWVCHPRTEEERAAAAARDRDGGGNAVPGLPAGQRGRMRGHNVACECSPEVALKIQFLRLVHSFCDHSDYKHLLLTVPEMEELDSINSKAGILAVRNVPDVDVTWLCRGDKGLLTKIVDVMMNEPSASTFRFWLARAVESFLRGSTSYADQTFLIRRGLLQHVATNIIQMDPRPKEILQSSFDLLGELIKFNMQVSVYKWDTFWRV